MEAQAAGLLIPRTLISNNPREIRTFIENAGEHIYKPLTGYVWEEDGSIIQTFTAKVTAELLPEHNLLASTPGIFQAKIPKKYEARIQFFGRFYGGVKIESHTLDGGDLDWRIGQGGIKACAPAVLPEEIYHKCLNLMERLDIVSGGFDFIIDENDQWIFLEVNEAGQFMFIETWCQSIPLTEAFCQFIERADPQFEYEPVSQPLTLREAYEDAKRSGLETELVFP